MLAKRGTVHQRCENNIGVRIPWLATNASASDNPISITMSDNL